MDYGYPQQQKDGGQFEEDNTGPFEGDGEVELEDHPHHHPGQQQRQYEQEGEEEEEDYYGEVQRGQDDHRPPPEDFDRKANSSARDTSGSSAAGKLFVGGISWETSEDTFANYFGKYGEIMDSVIMTDRHTGRPRGFGFVTFADVAVADRVLEQDHVIDGRAVEVKRTVPRDDASGKGVKRTKKVFIGGIPPSFTEDELKEYFSFYGGIVDHQILLDHKTGRSRGFGFVTFESEESVEQIFSEDKTHELGGKRVEIKKAEPKRPGGDYGNSSKAPTGYNAGGAGGYGSAGNMSTGRYGGKMGSEYGGGGGSYGGGYGTYGGYNSYGGAYPGSTSGFYGGYGGGGSGGYDYGFGFGGPMMYGGVSGAYGAGNYNAGAGAGAYGRGAGAYGGTGKGYGRMDGNNFGGSKGYPNSGAVGGGGYAGGGKGYGGNANGGAANTGRFHPYRK